MRPKLLLVVFVLLVGCASDRPLAPGTWTGALTPQRHPDLATPVAYVVSYPDDHLTIALEGPDGTALPTRDLRLDGDTLRFVFDEPEENVPLTCALGRDGSGFAGRCADAGGQWARFTMQPPD